MWRGFPADSFREAQEDECSKRSPESKLLSLTRKFGERLSMVETKCNEQEEKIRQLVGLEGKVQGAGREDTQSTRRVDKRQM